MKTPYEEGWDACKAGDDRLADNPYSLGSTDGYAWELGWEDAHTGDQQNIPGLKPL